MATEKYISLSVDGTLTEKIPAVAGGTGKEDQLVATDSGGHLADSLLSSAVKVIRLYGSLAGSPSALQELFAIELTGDEVFPAGLGTSKGSCDTAPTGSVVLDLQVNGVSIGSMNIAASATTATFTLSSTYTATAGDILAFYAPAVVDATLAGLRYTFVGTR